MVKILVVDDGTGNAEAVMAILQSERYEVLREADITKVPQ